MIENNMTMTIKQGKVREEYALMNSYTCKNET